MSDPTWTPPVPPQSYAAQEYAGWGARLGALIIDALIVGAVAFVLALPAASGSGNGVAGASLAVIYVVAYLYAPLTMMRKGRHNGQTFGKQAVGIRVRRDTGGEIGFWYAALREILVKGLIGTLTLGIDYLWPLWDKRNQALHDKIVATYVVRA